MGKFLVLLLSCSSRVLNSFYLPSALQPFAVHVFFKPSTYEGYGLIFNASCDSGNHMIPGPAA